MRSLDQREHAQLGLKYIEDSVVDLLTRHTEGMSVGTIADTLGLRTDLEPGHRDMIAAGILEMLVQSGRILWDADNRLYVDNPERS